MSKTKISKILMILVIMLLMIIIGNTKSQATNGLIWDRYSVHSQGRDYMLNGAWDWANKIMAEGQGEAKSYHGLDWGTGGTYDITQGGYDMYCGDPGTPSNRKKLSSANQNIHEHALVAAWRIGCGTNEGYPTRAEVMSMTSESMTTTKQVTGLSNSSNLAEYAYYAYWCSANNNTLNNWKKQNATGYYYIKDKLKPVSDSDMAFWGPYIQFWMAGNTSYSDATIKKDSEEYGKFCNKFNTGAAGYKNTMVSNNTNVPYLANEGKLGPCKFDVYAVDEYFGQYKTTYDIADEFGTKGGTQQEIFAKVHLSNGQISPTYKLIIDGTTYNLTAESNLADPTVLGNKLSAGQLFYVQVDGLGADVTIEKVTFESSYLCYQGVTYMEGFLNGVDQARFTIAGKRVKIPCIVEFGGKDKPIGAKLQIRKKWKDTDGNDLPADVLPASLPYTLLYYNTYGLTDSQKEDTNYIEQHCNQLGYSEGNLTASNGWYAEEDLTELVSAVKDVYGEEWNITVITVESDAVVAGYNFVESKTSSNYNDYGDSLLIEIILTNIYEKQPDNPVPFIEFKKLNEKGVALKGAQIGVTINNGEYYKAFRSNGINGQKSADITILFNDLIRTPQIQKDYQVQNAVELFNNMYSTRNGMRNWTTRVIKW